MTTPPDRLSAALADRYRVERELGQGGMATVYLAHDVRHDRKVAVKVLRPELAAILGAERFLNEIKVTANLQHPHILALYDSGEADGFLYYVMPYVGGESLRARLDREQQLPVEDALRIAEQVASALDYAHRQGIVHRDIKPGNILFHDGQALVADFGIALAVRAAGGARLTETGLSLGTPHYMSPEQATAERELDARSDVYSLACVLYEMLAGEPPFTGPNVQAIIAKLLTERARDLHEVRESVPAHVAVAVGRALAKLPADRFGGATAFTRALATPGVAAPSTPKGTEQPSATQARSRLMTRAARLAPWILAVVALVAAGVALRHPSPDRPVVRVAVALPSVQILQASRPDIEISPQGTHLVYPGVVDGRPVLLLRELDRLDARPLRGSEGAVEPFFSPDGEWVGFFAGGKLKKVALAGGPPINLADAPTPRGATWTDDGFIVFTPLTTGGLVRVSADGGPIESLTSTDSTTNVISHRWPAALPNGRGILFTTYTASFAESGVAVLDLASRTVTPLAAGATDPQYAASGHLLYVNVDGALVGRQYDPRHLADIGPAVTLVEGVSLDASTAGAGYSVSSNGTLVYLSGSLVGTIVRVNRDGSEQVLADSLVAPGAMRFSKDGNRLAMELQAGGLSSIWVYDLIRHTSTRLTFEGTARYPSWNPLRDRVLFAWNTAASQALDLYEVPADGSGTPTPVIVAPYDQYEGLWTPDARLLAVRQSVPETGRDIWVMAPDSATAPREFLRTRFNERCLALSPDGHWLAYVSDESGTDEVYVRAFPGPAGKWQISNGGGSEPAWSPDGRELFYRDPTHLVAVTVHTGATFSAGASKELFLDHYGRNPDHPDYAVHPSGQWFAMRRSDASGRELVLVVNWFQELKARERE
jgi:Tol biopolymer transport system component/tRNA A-37 threonylcarbamoyl transferase component Bud32